MATVQPQGAGDFRVREKLTVIIGMIVLTSWGATEPFSRVKV